MAIPVVIGYGFSFETVATGISMYVRIIRMPLKPGAAEAMRQAVQDYVSSGDLGGDFLGSLMLTNDDRSEALGVTFWRTREARDESARRTPEVMAAYQELLSDDYSLLGQYEVTISNMIRGIDLDDSVPVK